MTSSFLEHISSLPGEFQPIYLLTILVACWILEVAVPRFHFTYAKIRHDAVNLSLFAINAAIISSLLLVNSGLTTWAERNDFGLLYLTSLPMIVELIISLLILDFVAQYAMHFLLHHVKWMWRLHMVHHGDTHVDATTGTRHHPFDLFLRELAVIATIGLIGIPLVHYVLYRLITVFFTYFTHANIRLPYRLDRWLSLIIVTPDMHKFHHHQTAPWTDSNFGDVLSIWDRMFGTFVYENPDDIDYGLDVLDDARDTDLGYQFLLPWDSNVVTRNRPGLFAHASKGDSK
jgi:sterol desaturase/sphingolipid hydroxylase (fatty acid hydroxylase superfamily)